MGVSGLIDDSRGLISRSVVSGLVHAHVQSLLAGFSAHLKNMHKSKLGRISPDIGS